MSTEDYWVPRTLDAPNLFFLWEADQALMFMFWVFLFSVMGMFPLGVILGFVSSRVLARVKEEGGKGLFIRVLYWYSPSDLWFSEERASHMREFLG